MIRYRSLNADPDSDARFWPNIADSGDAGRSHARALFPSRAGGHEARPDHQSRHHQDHGLLKSLIISCTTRMYKQATRHAQIELITARNGNRIGSRISTAMAPMANPLRSQSQKIARWSQPYGKQRFAAGSARRLSLCAARFNIRDQMGAARSAPPSRRPPYWRTSACQLLVG